jgi:hypothetical protein
MYAGGFRLIPEPSAGRGFVPVAGSAASAAPTTIFPLQLVRATSVDSCRGIRSIRYESDRSGASFSASSAIDRPTFSAMLLGIDRRMGP